MKKILVLFPNDWDKVEFASERYRGNYAFEFLGDDYFKFPGYLRLLFLDAQGFVDRVIRKIRAGRFDAVLSTDEYIGAIIAAIAARETGLPGTDPAHIILSQHKYHSRLVQQQTSPEAAVKCALIPIAPPADFQPKLDFPFFVKPVKGTFSLFAKRVDSLEDLRRHLNFNMLERLALNRVVRPFNDLLKAYSDLEFDANHFVGEELISGVQVTVDGFAWENDITILGVVDSVMFPGTNIFERFEYPSRLPRAVQDRMVRVVTDFTRGLGISQGQYNVELFYDAATDDIRIIEINPRLSYQFADLYENVDGTNMYDILISLSLGRAPVFAPGQGSFNFSNSFVLRTFDGKKLLGVPGDADIARFNLKYPESKVKIYGRKGKSLAGEMRAIGSYRFGIVNVAAGSLLDLFAIYEDARDTLPFKFG